MNIISHLIVSYAISCEFKSSEDRFFFTIGGIAPDFDIVLYVLYILNNNLFIFKHRTIFHSPLLIWLWILIWYLVITSLMHSRYSLRGLMLMITGSYFHIFLDFLTTSAIPLYPINRIARLPIINSDSPIILAISMTLFLFIIIKFWRIILQFLTRPQISSLLSTLWSNTSIKKLRNLLISYLVVFFCALLLHSVLYLHLQGTSRSLPGNIVAVEPKFMSITQWIIIKENDTHYLVWHYVLGEGIISNSIYQKISILNGSVEEALLAIMESQHDPRVKELLYSGKPYIIIVEWKGGDVWIVKWINLERILTMNISILRSVITYEITVRVDLS